MFRLPPSLSLCALPLLLIGPRLVPQPAPMSAQGTGNTPPTCVLAQTSFTVFADAQATSVSVTLDACASFDPDQQPLTFDWDGCPISSFADDTACTTEMTIDLTGQTLPLVCDARLYLSDGVVTTQECRISVTVLPAPDLDMCSISCPSFVLLTGHGVMRSVLVANPFFDVSKVDKTSLFLRRADGTPGQVRFFASAREDIGTPSIGRVCDCAILGPDGNLDLTLLSDVRTMNINLDLFSVPLGTQVELEVFGKLLDGTEFTAQDCLTVLM